MNDQKNRVWYKALDSGEFPEGRVKPVTCGVRTLCLTHHQGKISALDNKCPHQGGPLGEGSIENGYLRCPRHGWDFDPVTGAPPGGYEVAERWRIWRDEKERRRLDDRGCGVNSSAIFAALTRQVDEDAILAVDVGNNTYSFGRYFECTRQSVLMSGYLGSIGFSLPAALGAWAATQEDDPRFHGRQVVSVSGDGGLGQYLADITTPIKYDMNITHVVLNNSVLGKISKEQRAGNWQVWQTSLHNPSFARFTESCGGLGLQVTHQQDLDKAMRKALDHPGFSLVEVMADAELI